MLLHVTANTVVVVGDVVGATVGTADGDNDGTTDGTTVGTSVGDDVGQVVVLGNAIHPMLRVTAAFQLTHVKGAYLKACSPMYTVLSGIVTDVRDEQLEKAFG